MDDQDQSPESSRPVSFETVFSDELELIARRRGEKPEKHDTRFARRRARELQLVGLALSGGGIRSATYCLGVLQSLAKLGYLSRIDYLSTVSGGGYIGAWLTSWLRRLNGIDVVEQELADTSTRPTGSNEPHPVSFLREFSNYLTPRTGLMSVDTWVVGSTYFRNFVNHFLVVVFAIVALFLLPKVAGEIFHWAGMQWTFLVAAGLMLICIALVAGDLENLVATGAGHSRLSAGSGPSKRAVFVAPIAYVAAWLMTAWLWDSDTESWVGERLGIYSMAIGGMYSLAWVLGFILVGIKKRRARLRGQLRVNPDSGASERFVSFFTICVTALLIGSVGGFLFFKLGVWFESWPLIDWPTDACGPESTRGRCLGAWDVVTFGPIFVMLIAGLTLGLHIGMAGHAFSQDAREWWSRLAASAGRLTLVVGAVCFLAIQGPWLLEWLGAQARLALTSGWIATVAAGYFARRNAIVGTGSPGLISRLLLSVTPYVFVVGLLLGLSCLANALVVQTTALHEHMAESGSPRWEMPLRGGLEHDPTLSGWEWIAAVVFVLAAFLWSWRVGINRFSLSEFYSNRLARCYLGASNSNRDRYTYTGFDPGDDQYSLHELLVAGKSDDGRACRKILGPYPIINTTLNMVSGAKLAWQKRKGASFILSPLYCGYEFPGSQNDNRDRGRSYVDSRRFASQVGGVKLGEAIAISGAAVNPNMGQGTTPAWSFLLSVLNLRLGRWVGNPRDGKTVTRSGPSTGLFYLILEMMGLTTDKRGYVHLSDGGHFENLGIYELVRRQCRFIIACDAEHDPNYKYSGLGNAIEKCRTDFGVGIEIDVDQIRPDKVTGLSRWHCAVGRIRYSQCNPDALDGVLVYLKSSVTGDEPEDLDRYRAENPNFPHHSTADQWFDETQFESYRMLGEHAGRKVFGSVPARDKGASIESFFVKLRERWYPPSTSAMSGVSKHMHSLDELLMMLSSNPDLAFLDSQMYPSLGRLGVEHAFQSDQDHYWAPTNQRQLRAGFYFCKRALVFMEGVFHDLHLQEEFNHPDNRGWMNLFCRWWWSRMFRFTWAVTGSAYGARFQTFCERRLGFTDGIVRTGRDDQVPYLTVPAEVSANAAALDALLKQNESTLGLNVFERKLTLELVTGEFRRACKITPLCIEIKEDPVDETMSHRINFGFAILGQQQDSEEKESLLYYRIQSHLRKMGLGRRGLVALLRECDAAPPSGKVSEVESERETPHATRQFRQMFLSVQRELKDMAEAKAQSGATKAS